MKIKLLALAVALLFVIPFSLGLTINPLEHRIPNPEFSREYQLVLTVINQEASDHNIELVLSPESEYLDSLIKDIDPQEFFLAANSKKNVKLAIEIPNSISPEEHVMTLQAKSNDLTLASFRLFIEVPGEQKLSSELKSFSVNNASFSEPLFFSFEIANTGNINVKGTPKVRILDKTGELVYEINPENEYLILPGTSSNLSIMYTDSVPMGDYEIEGYFEYEGKTTKTITKSLIVSTGNSDEINIKTISPEEMLYTSVNIDNPSGGIIFYKIFYQVKNTDISGTKEGKLEREYNLVELEADTTELNEGDYTLLLDISYGRALEKHEEEQLPFRIKKEKANILNLIASWAVRVLFVMLLLFVLYVVGFLAYSNRNLFSELCSKVRSRAILRKRGADSISAKGASKKDARDFSHLERISAQISKISKKYDNHEDRLRKLSRDINVFTQEINQFLRARRENDV
jgi:hypothetical protein